MEQIRRLRVVEKHWETPDAVTVVLKPEDDRPYLYQPGQYLSVIREINGQEKRRAYSFSSSPGVDAHPAITVKRISNGEFSNWLLEKVQPGDVLRTGAPAGRFILPEKPPRRLVYLAGGSGITPVLSHLKALFAEPSGLAVTLLYVNRDRGHTIFKDQIARWTAEYAHRFQCIWLFSRDKAAPDALHGHLNNALFESQITQMFGGKMTRADRLGAHFFLCAPNALMRMARMTLRVLDVPETHIHQETFLPDTRLPKRPLDTSKTHRIIVNDRNGERVEFDIYEGETILNGALRQQIALPYTCKSGVCLSCLAQCRRGEVELDFVENTRREGPGGIVNTCIGYALTEEVELGLE